jgi:hypothetical protein
MFVPHDHDAGVRRVNDELQVCDHVHDEWRVRDEIQKCKKRSLRTSGGNPRGAPGMLQKFR